MKIIETKTQTAFAVIGLQRGYSENIITNDEIRESIIKAQKIIKDKNEIHLSINIIDCKIIFLGQEEASIKLEFINYPKFLAEEKAWDKAVLAFSKEVMIDLEQNRIVIVFPEKTIMIELSDAIDPKIDLN